MPRPSCVDFSTSDWSDASRPAPRKRLRPRSGVAPVAGAVRLSIDATPRHRQLLKMSAGLLFAAGGILATTASTGTVEEAPRRIMAASAIPQPAFFFGDRDNALDDANTAVPEVTTALPVPGVIVGFGKNDSDPLVDDAAVAIAASVAFDDVPKRHVSTPSMHPSIAALRDRHEAPEGTITDAIIVASGDTLSGILNRNGVKVDRMPKLLTDDLVKTHLASLRIGQTLSITRFPDGRFHSLSAKVGAERKVTIRRSNDGFAVASIDLPVEKERVVSSGTIEQSLYLAAKQANLKQSTIMELADIFQWELDFARDIRAGDQFSVVYDRLYREGRYIGDGDILAAEFVRGGKRYEAIRFTTDDGATGYFSPDGRSKRRTFTRHPVDVVRITSRFDPNRMHPVLHQLRAHRGVDYGSPHGTPILATADGTISFSGTKGGYGSTVVIKHGHHVDTLYAHMSRIDPESTVGKRVRQGDVIGYVGRTGRVTGTHLHYEFRKNGKHVDPLAVELPAAAPLDERYREELRIVGDQMIAQMQSVVPTALAASKTTPSSDNAVPDKRQIASAED